MVGNCSPQFINAFGSFAPKLLGLKLVVQNSGFKMDNDVLIIIISFIIKRLQCTGALISWHVTYNTGKNKLSSGYEIKTFAAVDTHLQ